MSQDTGNIVESAAGFYNPGSELRRMLKNSLQTLIRRLKNAPDYTIDAQLPTTALVTLIKERGLALVRGWLRRPFLAECGGALFVGRRVQLLNTRSLHLGRSVTLEDDVKIDALSREGVWLGNSVAIGRFTVIECTGVITHLGQGFRIGDHSNLGDYNFVGAAGGVSIGQNVLIGQGVRFHSENHVTARTDIPIKAQGVSNRGIVVEDDVWLGSGAILLDGVRVGTGAVVAAGSVVTREVPPFAVVGGSPAQVLKYRQEPSPQL
ncbi:MAG: acyltransferase [Caldilineales bacterium]|nr:acyltransferase [Caldilineales bacterium]